MLRVTRTLVKRFWGMFAILLISVAVIVAVGREFTPQVAKYKTEIEDYLSDTMGVTVSIDAVHAEWRGLTPEVRLRGIELSNQFNNAPTDDQQHTILSVTTAVAELSLVRSLFNGQLVWSNIELVKVRMGFQQNENATWSLIGMPALDDADNLDIDDPLDVFLQGRRIELRDADITFQFSTGHQSQVQLPHLLLQNSGNFHRLSSSISIDRDSHVLTLMIEGEGDPRDIQRFAAKGYLRLENFELDKAMAALPGELWQGLPNQEWRKGHLLNFESWFDIAPGMEITTRGRIDVGEPPVALTQQINFPNQTGASFAGRWLADGAWQLTLRDVLLRWGDILSPSLDVVLSSKKLGEPIAVRAAQLDIEDWLNTLTQVGFVQGRLAEALAVLQPKGVLRQPQLIIEGTALDAIRLQANLENISVESWNGAPQLKQVNGYVNATPVQGYVDLYSHTGFSMFYPQVFKQPMEFDHADGRVNWQLDLTERDIRVHSGLMTVAGDMGKGRGYFSLYVPFDFGSKPEELIVQVGVQDSNAQYHELFTPRTLPEPLMNWLVSSVGEGIIPNAGFIYRGGFTGETIGHTALQLHGEVTRGTLNYHADWPSISHINGELWLEDNRVTGEIDTARFLDSQVTDTQVVVEAGGDKGIDLLIDGELQGDASDGLRLFNETPLKKLVGDRLAIFELTGAMRANAQLEIPLFKEGFQEGLEDSKATENSSTSEGADVKTAGESSTSGNVEPLDLVGKHRINVQIIDGDLAIPTANLVFTKVNGQITYHEKNGIAADDLTANLWDYPLTVDLAQQQQQRQRPNYELTVEGRSSVAALNEWLQAPELEFLGGETNYAASVIIPTAASPENMAFLNLTSDLIGVDIDLPPPFFKASETPKNIAVSIPLGARSATYAIRYDGFAYGLLEFFEGELNKLAISLGEKAVLPERNQFVIGGILSEFDLDAWQTTLAQYQSYLTPDSAGNVTSQRGAQNFSPRIDLRFDRFSYQDYVVENLHLKAVKDSRAWQLALDSAMVRGDVNVFDDGETPLQLRLEHLVLTNSKLEELEQTFTEDSETKTTNSIADTDIGQEKSAKEDPLQHINPAELPAMDVVVKSFLIDGDDLGSWSFNLRPVAEGVVVSQLRANIKGAQIYGLDETGATLWWSNTDQGQLTRFAGKVVSDQLGNVLAAWGQPRLIDSDAAQFTADVNWMGSPAAITTIGLVGDVTVALESGAFANEQDQQGTGGALLQLISFFNVDSWLRRLRFDFSDLGRKGVPFDEVAGTLAFAEGKVVVAQPMVIEMPSGKFQMTGVVDLVEEEVDARLIATLPVGGNLTVVAALAAGLPAALGVYLVSKIFEKQMDKVASLRYQVNGSLNDPDLKFERLFDDDVIAPSSEKPAAPEADSTSTSTSTSTTTSTNTSSP